MADLLGRGDSQWCECMVFREQQSDQTRQKIRKGEGSEAGMGGWYQITGCLETQRSVGRGEPWRATPVFLPGKSHGQRSLAGYSPWGRKELDMTEHEASLPYNLVRQVLLLSPHFMVEKTEARKAK